MIKAAHQLGGVAVGAADIDAIIGVWPGNEQHVVGLVPRANVPNKLSLAVREPITGVSAVSGCQDVGAVAVTDSKARRATSADGCVHDPGPARPGRLIIVPR